MESLATGSSTNYVNDECIESLSPYSDAIGASRILFLRLTSKLNTHWQEILHDAQNECLHDFRITIRKIRTLLSQLGDVVPEPGLSIQCEAFKSVMDKTSLLRDIEVCNQMLKKTVEEISSAGQIIEPIQNHMESYEKQERKNLIEFLKSDKYQQILNQWGDFLETLSNDDINPERSRSPIRLVASEAIAIRYLKTIKQAEKLLNDETDIERIHKLRKSGKELRYLVDLFSELYTDKVVTKVIKQLKKFQDCLGNRQDSEVQIQLLNQMSESIYDNLTRDNRKAIELIIKFKKKQKQRFHKNALKLIRNYTKASNNTMAKLIRI